ncbi:unnamed protein product [Caenorhabditis nigoni]
MQAAVANVDYRRYGILLYFQLHREVLQTVEDLKNVFPDISFAEVDAWFTRFRSGNMDILTPVVFNEGAPGMADIPVHLKRKITENVGYTEQKSLLSVDNTFREILKADRRLFNQIKVRHGMNGISLLFNVETIGVKETKFLKKSQGCEIKNGDAVTASTHPYYVEAVNQLLKVLKKDSVKIKKLLIEVDRNQPDRHLFLLEIENGFKSLKTKIHVEELKADLETNEDIVMLLENIKVGPLKATILSTREKRYPLHLDDSPLISSHLSSMTEVLWCRVILDIPLSHMAHLVRFNGEIHSIVAQEITDYKNKIILAPDFKYARLSGAFQRETILAALQPLDEEDAFDATVGSWPHASSEGHKIIVKLNRRSIEFRSIRQTEVSSECNDCL